MSERKKKRKQNEESEEEREERKERELKICCLICLFVWLFSFFFVECEVVGSDYELTVTFSSSEGLYIGG